MAGRRRREIEKYKKRQLEGIKRGEHLVLMGKREREIRRPADKRTDCEVAAPIK